MSIVELLASHQSISAVVIDYWKRAYKIHPRATVVATILVALALAAVVFFAERQQRIDRDRQAALVARYDTQLRQLDSAEKNLHDLVAFVGAQRRQLENTEQAIAALKAEHVRLQPLVAADRKAVEALFAAQEARNATSQVRERWYGFGGGVLASLLASLLWYGGSYLAKRKTRSKENTESVVP